MELSPMKRCNALLFLLLILLPGVTSYLCSEDPTINFRSVNNGTLFPLDTDGLVGRYAGAWNNGTDYSDISFQLWFLSYDDNSNYFLALVAIREPQWTWDLLRPMVLWSASRETSNYVGENATLIFEANSGFQLRDADGRLAWSSSNVTNATRFCFTNLASIQVFNGNQLLWRSSDFPSNTMSGQVSFLPGNSLVSWTSRKNATKGAYSLEMTRNGLGLKFKTETYWEFNFPANVDVSDSSFQPFSVFCWQENGLITLDLQTNYSSLVEPTQNFLSAESCAQRPPATQTQLLLTNATDLSYATFVRLEDNGDLVYYTWSEETDYWLNGYSFSTSSRCFLPSQCGPYGLCNKTTGGCIESCPSSNGEHCNTTVSSDPVVEFEFRTVPGRDYFSINYTVPQQVQSQEQCMQICQTNSTCKAAFFRQTDCFLTHEDVQTLQTGEFVAFLKASKLEKLETIAKAKKQRRLMDIGLGVLVPALVLLFVCLTWTWKRHQKHLEETSDKEDSDMELSLMEIMPRRFTYKELEQVTGNFSDCLGEGGYGSVYKGVLPEGTIVAVKKLLGANQRSQDFYAEIASLARTNHLNLVRFLGFCAQGPTKRLLVYEFMVNGSLDKWIFEDENKGGSLSWLFKYQIAAGTAQGLCYLHEECAERIIHLDLKPENVLLDGSFIPKIADFGLSKLMNREVTYLQMTSMRGTPGYLAPEYLQVGTITEKSDVFSFGVLLLEIITGCRNKSLSSDYLTSLAGATASRSDEKEVEVASRLRTVAYLCIQDDPDLRPSMSNVVKMMEGLVELPKLPSDSDVHFFIGYRSRVKLPTRSSSASTMSPNETTKLVNSSTSFGVTSLRPR